MNFSLLLAVSPTRMSANDKGNVASVPEHWRDKKA